MNTNPYWLIERTKTDKGPGVHWFSERRCFAQGDEDIWVEDVTRAEHFATKELAEKSIRDRFTLDGVFTPCSTYPVLPIATEHLDVEMRCTCASGYITHNQIDPDCEWHWNNMTAPHAGVCTRLFASPTHGVGVVAIIPIAKGTSIWPQDKDLMGKLVRKVDVDKLPAAIRQMYHDFSPFNKKEQAYEAPPCFNLIWPAWYLNHSKDNPNVKVNEEMLFFAVRDIEVGEELLVDYTTFSDESGVL